MNKGKISQDLKDYPEIISEGIQTILRREGIEGAYEKMKELTRGKKIGKDDIKKFIKNLNVAEEVKKELLELAPENYIGLAKKICDIKL